MRITRIPAGWMRTRWILFAWILTSCSYLTPDAMLNSWLGKTEHDLVLSWGPPTRVDSDGAGGRILSYIRAENWVSPYVTPGEIVDHGDGTASYTPPKQASGTSMKVRQFYVNAEGRIYSWRYQGL